LEDLLNIIAGFAKSFLPYIIFLPENVVNIAPACSAIACPAAISHSLALALAA